MQYFSSLWRTAFYFSLCLFPSSFQLNICREWVAVSARGRALGYIRNSSCFMSERSEGKTPTGTRFSAYLNRLSNTKEKIIIWTPTDQGPTHAFHIYPHPHLHRERRSHPLSPSTLSNHNSPVSYSSESPFSPSKGHFERRISGKGSH